MSYQQRTILTDKRWRFTYVAVLPLLLLALALVEPGSLPKWFPFAISCGAITGLPCIFCGMTRAVHYLLVGEFAKALYYNWLAFPFVTSALAIFVVYSLELIFNRKILVDMPSIRLTRSSLSALALGVVLLWCLQVYLAVSKHKTELLNPNGPLYTLIVH